MPPVSRIRYDIICRSTHSAIVTGAELVTGMILNVWLGLGIWDYSGMPFNYKGQICLPFSILWIFVSIAAIVLDCQIV